MAGPIRDADKVRAGITTWLADRVEGSDVHLEEFDDNAFSGFSNETILTELSWTDVAGAPKRQGIVIRIEPIGHQVFRETLFDEQVRVLRALAATDIPVAEVLWYEPDPSLLGARFMIMARLDGRVPPDSPTYHQGGWMHDVTPDERARVWWSGLEAMAAVHNLDHRAAGLDFLAEPGLAQQVKAERAYLDWVRDSRPHPLVERAFDWLEANVPDEASHALVWGDSRIGNVMFDGAGEVVAVLDWEMVLIGDPIQDLAWFLLLDRHHWEGTDVPRLDGFPSPGETAARWSELTGRGARPDVLAWHECFAAARFSAIMLRVIGLVETTGLLEANSDMGFDNGATKILARILDELGG